MTTPSISIVDLTADDPARLEEVARVMHRGFAGHSPAWPTLELALEEVRDTVEPGRISRIALNEQGEVMGLVGGRPEYDGLVWELHPLVVDVRYQGKGVGCALVEDLEVLVKARGANTILLGTDDETFRTTLSGIDLFPNVFEHVARVQNPGHHPYEFYQKLGFHIVGVIPDANGPGKPDILMAKSLVR